MNLTQLCRGDSMKQYANKQKPWTKDEEEIMEQYWGRWSVTFLSEKLQRTERSITNKAWEMRLGAALDNVNGITLNQLSKAINVPYMTVRRWVDVYGLKVRKSKLTKRTVLVITMKDWWDFAEKNRYLIDFSRFDKKDLGIEPDWVDECRRADKAKKAYNRKRKDKWTKEEITILKSMVKTDCTYSDISKRIKRSEGAIKKKLSVLRIMQRPLEHKNTNKTYSEIEIAYILESLVSGNRSLEQLSLELDRSVAGIRNKIKRMGFIFDGGELVSDGRTFKDEGIKRD